MGPPRRRGVFLCEAHVTKSTKTPPKTGKEPKRAAKKSNVTKKAANKTPAQKKPSTVGTPGKVGRPSKMTADVLAKLDIGFMCGASQEEACVFAGIGETTLKRYMDSNPEYRTRIKALLGQPRLIAKANILAKLKEGDIGTSWEVLERGRVDGYTKPQEPSKPGVQVNVNAAPLAPGETDEGRKALEALHALFSGRALPGPEHQSEG